MGGEHYLPFVSVFIDAGVYVFDRSRERTVNHIDYEDVGDAG